MRSFVQPVFENLNIKLETADEYSPILITDEELVGTFPNSVARHRALAEMHFTVPVHSIKWVLTSLIV